MGWERGAGFRITGAVVRTFVSQSGKFAKLTLATPGARTGEQKTDVRSFDLVIIEEIRNLGAGQTVMVTGSIDSEPVKDKKGEPVLIDGYKNYVAVLTAKAIKVEGSSVAPANGPPATGSAADKGW